MNRIIKSTALTLIFLAILFHAAFSGMDKVAQRRESRFVPTSLDQALDVSLAAGDCRRVDFRPLGWEV